MNQVLFQHHCIFVQCVINRSRVRFEITATNSMRFRFFLIITCQNVLNFILSQVYEVRKLAKNILLQ